MLFRSTTDDALYAPIEWKRSGDYRDISYDTAEGIAKITICRPEVRNAFRPQTLFELSHAFNEARDDPEVGVIVLTGQGDMFVRPDWTRRGLGRSILEAGRDAAEAEGFLRLDLMATLAGVPLYRSFGFVEREHAILTMPDGVTIEAVAMDRDI